MKFTSDDQRKAVMSNLNNSHVKRDGITIGDSIASKRSDPNKMLRTKQGLELRDDLKAKVLPVFHNYIESHYPGFKTELRGNEYVFKTAEELGRVGKYDETDHWCLTDPTFEDNELTKGAIIGPYQKILDENPGIVELWNKIQTTGGNEKLRDQFLREYVQAEIDVHPEEKNMKVVKTKNGYSKAEVMSPSEQFLQDVTYGKIKDNGLKLSRNQVLGKPPAGGWFNELNYKLVGGEKTIDGFRDNAKKGAYVGLMITIDDVDDSLDRYYKAEMIITDIIDDYHYRVKAPSPYRGDFIIRDTDIRSVVGDIKHNYSNLSDLQYTELIIPKIKSVMENES